MRYIDTVAIHNLPMMLYVFAGIYDDCFKDGSASLKATAYTG
jgi:hypothetical protein